MKPVDLSSSLLSYISGTVGEKERLFLQYGISRPFFLKTFGQIFGDEGYALANQIKATATTSQKAQLLEVGCNEGLGLQDVVKLLEERGLGSRVELIGLDINRAAIAEAEKRARSSGSDIHYYLHDVTVPLESNALLAQETGLSFDFIFATYVLEHLPYTRQVVERLYHYLKPGGVLYLVDYSYDEGADGWIAPHPAIASILKASERVVRSIPGWENCALEQADWLTAIGADKVKREKYVLAANCDTPENIAMLKNFLYTTLNVGSVLVKRGLLEQTVLEQTRATLMKELGPAYRGQMTVYSTIATKPISEV